MPTIQLNWTKTWTKDRRAAIGKAATPMHFKVGLPVSLVFLKPCLFRWYAGFDAGCLKRSSLKMSRLWFASGTGSISTSC